MGFIRKPICTPVNEMKLTKALAYESHDVHPRTTQIPVIIPVSESIHNPRFPCFEALWGAGRPIAETIVEHKEGEDLYQFLIAVQYGRHWPVNKALRGLEPNFHWRGKMIVMLLGDRVFVKDLGESSMRACAKAAVRQYIASIKDMVAGAIEDHVDPITVIPTEVFADE